MGDEQNAKADRDQACRLNADRAYCGEAERSTPTAALVPAPAPTLVPTPTMVPTLTPVPTFIVTKTADTFDGTCDADCSLREAIIAAVSGAAIGIPAGVYTWEIQELTIAKDLTLIGDGSQKTIIQAAKSPESAVPFSKPRVTNWAQAGISSTPG